jgi:hypothetical protein
MSQLDQAKRLMGALRQMKLKQHDEMKIRKSRAIKTKSLTKKRASSKPKSVPDGVLLVTYFN